MLLVCSLHGTIETSTVPDPPISARVVVLSALDAGLLALDAEFLDPDAGLLTLNAEFVALHGTIESLDASSPPGHVDLSWFVG